MCRGKAAKTYARLSKQKLAPYFSPFPRPFSHSPVLSRTSLCFPALPCTHLHFPYTSLGKAHPPLLP